MQADRIAAHDPVLVGPVQRALVLKTFPGFAALDSAQIAVLAAVTRERFFRKGDVLHEPDRPVLAFYLTVTGEVQGYRDGRPAMVYGPRSSIGGLAALTGTSNHAVALTDVLALEIDADDMDEVFEDHFPILLGVLGALATALREAQVQAGGGAAVDRKSEMRPAPATPLNLVERMFFFRQTANFASASIEALSDLVQDLEERRYEPGQVLWNLGDPAESSLLIVDGVLECEAEGVKPFTFERGFIVGGLDALSRQPRWYSARAGASLRVIELPRMQMFDVLEDHVDMAMMLVRTLANGVLGLLSVIAARREGAGRADSAPQGEEADE